MDDIFMKSTALHDEELQALLKWMQQKVQASRVGLIANIASEISSAKKSATLALETEFSQGKLEKEICRYQSVDRPSGIN